MKKVALLSTLLLAGSALAASPKDTLVLQYGSDVPTLDPGVAYDTASGEMIENMYETLVGYKGNSLKTLEPVLATKWTASNGGKTYTFDLRKNVKFHSGAVMTCTDAEYTFERNLVTNSAESGNWFIAESLLGTQSNANDDKNVTWAKIDKSVECNSKGQLVFTLPKVDPAFLAKLAYAGQSIVEKKYNAGIGEWDGTEKTWKSWVGKDLTGSNLSKKPNGTGPYRLVKQDANNLLFQAFGGYWGKAPTIKNVIRQKVTEIAPRQQAFLRGDADVIEGGGRNVDEAQIKGKPGVAWVDNLPNTTSTVIFMNQNIKATNLLGSGKLDGKGIPANFFKDANLRRAFSYSFNYQQYIADVQKGKGKQRTMALPDSFLGYDPKVSTYKFDKAKATQYFKQAWGGNVWKNGFTMTVNYRAGSVPAQTAMEILKRNVEAINPKFRINIQPKQWSEMLSASKKGEEAMVMIGWAPDYADPDNFIYTFYASDGFYSPRSNFKDASIDKWVKQARATVNTAERSRLYSLVGKRAYEQAPYILVPGGVNYTFYRNNIVGVSASTYNPMTSGTLGVLWKDLSKK
ncbi:ABC transporter substrate-binding protein [Deinococcus wulumuqiensis]|uniref:Peptide ABC transporter substrate-binding protein n=1 Tax=Deinococcus wulumuqiensis TaxID=980427 RepID=A0AAV4K3A7_9DEIO|nr:ABC transporter substrate-binding protein [Deinococcus wulumuqiensis]QII21021.1 ABC transporter substrate-binding protein [Deinococcus wulumuqiensis R12]GGI79962.1 peptide ABC transporter substrate-binding protein [Deinococcus wulumuqiensis]GGP29032.1 peptide ABC transporter substrate-binding protein [Deinococcus wulumuqiensis]